MLGWEGIDVSTICVLGDTLSGCVTQRPRLGPLGACAIHPTHPFCMGFMYPAWCVVCMVSGVCFVGRWYVLILLVLGWEGVGHKHSWFAFWVTHSVGVSLRTPSEACAIHPFCVISARVRPIMLCM